MPLSTDDLFGTAVPIFTSLSLDLYTKKSYQIIIVPSLLFCVVDFQQAFLDIGYEMKLELGHRHSSQGEVTRCVLFVKGPENASSIEQYVDKVRFHFPEEEMGM